MQHKRTISVIIFGLYVAAVTYLCFARPEDMPTIPQSWFGLPADKVGHFIMFAPFPLLGFIAFENSGMGWKKKEILIAILLTVGFGMAACTEKIQAALEYRSADKSDLLADGLGLMTGGIMTLTYMLIKRR